MNRGIVDKGLRVYVRMARVETKTKALRTYCLCNITQDIFVYMLAKLLSKLVHKPRLKLSKKYDFLLPIVNVNHFGGFEW